MLADSGNSMEDVIIRAAYRVGSKSQELVCPACGIRRRVWVEFDEHAKGLPRLAPSTRTDALCQVRLQGVFSRRGHFGYSNAYDYQFVARKVLSAERLWQATRDDNDCAAAL